MKYCSKKCFGLAFSGKNNPRWNGGMLESKCVHCKKSFRFYKSARVRGRFCRYECYLKSVHRTPEEKRKRQKLYRDVYWNKPENKERKDRLGKARREKIKLSVLKKYSGNPPKCKCCKEVTVDFLTIDHINGGGNEHRRKFNKSVSALYFWLYKNPKIDGLQVLCFNCNITKGFIGICPHQKRK